MKAARFIVRCYAEKKEDQWQVFCLDFCLAAQANSYDEAKEKLDLMISEYIYDALAGEDKEYAEPLLLNRRAPAKYWVKYYFYKSLFKCGCYKDSLIKLFNEPIPMMPSDRCKHA